MKIQILLFLGILLGSTFQSKSQTYNLHWGGTIWGGTPRTFQNKTFKDTAYNLGGSNVNVTVDIHNSSRPVGQDTTNNSTTATNNGNYFQFQTPKIGSTNTTTPLTWFLPGSTGFSPLTYFMDWTDMTYNVTTTIKFSQPVKDVQFYLGDMDRTTPLTYVDRFTFTGTNNGVLAANPVVTKFQPTITGVDTVLINGNTAYGNSSSTNNYNANSTSAVTQGATIFVQYSSPVNQITLYWDQGPGAAAVGTDPGNQAVTIGDIQFTKVTPPISAQSFPPVADNFTNTPMPQGNAATAIPGLVAADPDGTITSYKIVTIPAAAEGVLSYCSNATSPCTGTVTSIIANTTLTPAQMATLRFDPSANFAGIAQFTFSATDNAGNPSNIATYRLPIVAQPPVSNNIMENSMINTNGPTAIQGLISSDADGTIASYQLTSLPPAAQGVLSVPCGTGANPTLTGATCTGGFQDLTATILGNYPSGIPLTATQIAGMRFDPAAGFTGNATFNYNATDNSGNISNAANYTVPVTATATITRPPLADNITSQSLNNSLGNTAIPALQANDLDGTVSSYKITSLPLPATGILRISCPSTPAGLTCTGSFADILVNTVLTPAESARLFFDPAPGFTGTANFAYTATDNTGLVSNTATYSLPIINNPPVSTNIDATVPFNGVATAIPALSGSDADGTVASYTIVTIPTAGQGVLSYCSNGTSPCTGTLTTIAANTSLTPAQAATLKFAPTTNFSGSAPFTYISTDNTGNISAAASYNIRVELQPPATKDTINAVLINTAGPTVINGINATDADGTIASYKIFSVPDPSQGILSVPCGTALNPTPAGATCTGGFADITAATLAADSSGIALSPTQAAGLRFDPTTGYAGLVSFKFGAIDNTGLLSNVSNYVVPVSAGATNIPPVAKNIITPAMPGTNGPTVIPALAGTDPDGTIASYTLKSIPSVLQGVLSYCSNGTSPCTGTITDITDTLTLTPAQAATLKFDPAPGFVGKVDFAYTTKDNTGATSAGAIYTIPVTGVPPIANAIVAPAMPQTNGATAIPALVATDADNAIATYTIQSIPDVSQGILSIACPATPTGATCTGGRADLTAAVLAANPLGIVLTPAQITSLQFDPAPGYQGNVVFNYHANDASGLISNATTYTIPVTGLPPVSKNIVAPKMPNTNAATAIPGLVSTDADGSIASYIINNIPPASQGVLYYNNGASVVPVTAGLSLTAAQMATLQFDPSATYNGNVIFNYAAFDNNGNISNVATYTIPTGSSAVLPVSLLNFTGERKGNDILLKWKTSSEINVSRYEIEYSTAVDFKNGGFTPALNGIANNYQYTLANFTAALYYIRLKVLDADGRFTYSNVIAIRLLAKADIKIYPIPADGFVNIEFGAAAKGKYSLQLTDVTGRVISSEQIQNVEPGQIHSIQRNNLGAGVYNIRIQNNISGEITINKIFFK